MKVQFTESVGEMRANYGRGRIYDTTLSPDDMGYIPEESAIYYINKGMAIEKTDLETEIDEKAKQIEELIVEIEKLKLSDPVKRKSKESRPLKGPKSKSKKVSTRPVK